MGMFEKGFYMLGLVGNRNQEVNGDFIVVKGKIIKLNVIVLENVEIRYQNNKF